MGSQDWQPGMAWWFCRICGKLNVTLPSTVRRCENRACMSSRVEA